MARESGRENVPAVQKLRIQHAKRGRLRFTSHRDFQRAFERALRRADVPMAYSSGFSPHPKVSYANAAPTGVASEAEYVEIGVLKECDPIKLREKLDAVLPPGLDILDVVIASTSDFVARLEASHWQIELPGISPQVLSEALTTFLAADEVLVERMTKSGMRVFDARQAVVRAVVAQHSALTGTATTLETLETPDESGIDPNCAILALVVRHGVPTVRPDDVLAALSKIADLVPVAPSRITRLAQGPLLEDGWSVGDPLAADRSQV
ncbi:MAG: TIGR03936 family radical SAM-associated protein [Actinomycetes bacterium]